jgi:hypothetical protein
VGIFLVIALIAVFIVLGPELSRSYIRLDTSNPLIFTQMGWSSA